ncbi:MAG: glycosyltransferase, partial [Rhodospirillales bacterium]|nr:glycosyltransferase [Rhodospirillales bacterium]
QQPPEAAAAPRLSIRTTLPSRAGVLFLLAVLALASATPVLMLIWVAARSAPPGFESVFTLDNWRTLFVDDIGHIGKTLQLAVLTVVISTPVGVLFAWLTTRTDLPWRRTMPTLMILPQLVSPLVTVVAYISLLQPRAVRQEYLAFLGRICPEKRPDRAIRIARDAGLKLKIAAKVDRVDQAYWEEEIRPLVDGRQIEMIGEIGDHEKAEFLSGAHALLLPIDWPEPFGLVMIEAMACGTPVVAFPAGSVPEIVEHGRTGFIVRNETEAVAALGRLDTLSRTAIRGRFEERFTSRRMAEDYLAVYRRLAIRQRPALRVVT